jgi:Kef-type K+ transport system membrane component KefB
VTDTDLPHLLISTVLFLAAALTGGRLFEYLRMPRVVGEIVSGIALGPSLLGWLFPGASAWLFGDVGSRPLPFLYWTGVILLMFISGFRIQRKLSADDRKTIAVIFVFAAILPFALGFVAPLVLDLNPYMGSGTSPFAFQIVFGVAVAVTSIPVISKIFLDLGIIGSRFAKLVLASATLEDLALWSALSVATALALSGSTGSAPVDVWKISTVVATTLGFLGLSFWLGPRLLAAVSRHRLNPFSRSFPIAYMLGICLLFAGAASLLGVNVIFGALLAGVAVGVLSDDRFSQVKDRISEVSLSFFVPIYFALVGFEIDLIRHFDPMLTLVFIAATSIAKMGGTFVAARLTRVSHLASFNLAVAMNTRGGPGIVLASVALAAGIIEEKFYVTLVLAAIITSLASGVWFRFVIRRGWPLY